MRPASVTSSATPISSSGSDLTSIDADLEALVNALSDAGSDLSAATWVLHPRSAVYLSRLRGSGGAPAFPGIGARGGQLLGMPVLTSRNVPVAGDTHASTIVALVDPSMISVSDDGGSEVGVSLHSAVEMSDTPATGAVSQISLWQNDLAGLRVLRECNWKLRQPGGAQVLTAVDW